MTKTILGIECRPTRDPDWGIARWDGQEVDEQGIVTRVEIYPNPVGLYRTLVRVSSGHVLAHFISIDFQGRGGVLLDGAVGRAQAFKQDVERARAVIADYIKEARS